MPRTGWCGWRKVNDLIARHSAHQRTSKPEQYASVADTAFAIASIGVAAFDVSLFGLASGTLAAIVAIGGIAWLGVAGLKGEPWVDWLREGPLSKTVNPPQHPIHKNLGDTMQMLSNANAAL